MSSVRELFSCACQMFKVGVMPTLKLSAFVCVDWVGLKGDLHPGNDFMFA